MVPRPNSVPRNFPNVDNNVIIHPPLAYITTALPIYIILYSMLHFSIHVHQFAHSKAITDNNYLVIIIILLII